MTACDCNRLRLANGQCAGHLAYLNGGMTLEEIGQLLSLTRERVRQIEVRALKKLKRAIARGELDLARHRGQSLGSQWESAGEVGLAMAALRSGER